MNRLATCVCTELESQATCEYTELESKQLDMNRHLHAYIINCIVIVIL